MTKRALIKQAEINRLAVVAKRNNITVEVEADGYTIRLNPRPTAGISTDQDPEPEEFTSFAEWQAWRERERAREAQSNSVRDPRWDIPRKEIPLEPIQPPLSWREQKAMEYLMERGAEVRVDWYALKTFGAHTQKSLQERGFVEVSPDQDKYKHPSEIWLTRAGAKAMRDQCAHYDKYPHL